MVYFLSFFYAPFSVSLFSFASPKSYTKRYILFDIARCFFVCSIQDISPKDTRNCDFRKWVMRFSSPFVFHFLTTFFLVPFNFLSRFSFPRHSIQIQLALIHPVVCAVCNAMLVCARMRHKKSARHSDFFEYIKLPLFYLQFHKTPHRLHLKNESLNFGWTWNVTQFIMQTYCHFIDIKK